MNDNKDNKGHQAQRKYKIPSLGLEKDYTPADIKQVVVNLTKLIEKLGIDDPLVKDRKLK